MSKQKGFTPISNDFIDNILCDLSGNATKLYLIIERLTTGWKKESDRISLTQFEVKSKLSRPTVIKALNELLEANLITIEETTKGNVYTLNQLNNLTSKESLLVKNFNQTSKEILLAASKESLHTKETLTKETIQKKVCITPEPKKPVQKSVLQKLTDAGCSEQLAKDFIEHRKTKKSAITDTALKLISSQAEKAGIEFSKAVEICIARNWVSFNASWKWQDETAIAQFSQKPQQTPRFGEKPKANFLDVTPPKKTNSGFLEASHVRV